MFNEIADGVVMGTKESYIITVRGNEELETQVVEKTPFYIGSRDKSDLCLQGAEIHPTHIRLLSTNDNQILIICLAVGVKLNGELLKVFQPILWSLHGEIILGKYQLNLEIRKSQAQSQQAQGISTLQFPRTDGLGKRENAKSYEEQFLALGVSANGNLVSENESGMDVVEETYLFDSSQEILSAISKSSPADVPIIAKENPTITEPVSRLEALHQSNYQDSKVVLQEELPRLDEPITQSWNEDTLPKEWIQGRGISVQVAYSPINVALGECVSVPISVHSHLVQSTKLQVIVAGEQLDWMLDYPRTIQLEPESVMTLDVALRIPSQAQLGRAIFRVYVSEVVPQAVTSIDFILDFVIKNNPNISGILTPEIIHDRQRVDFVLRNLTRVSMQVGIDSAMMSDVFGIECDEKVLELSPGQAVKIPVRFQVKQRAWLLNRKYPYHLTATTMNRAPVRFSGQVVIRSQIMALLGSWLLLYMLLMLGMLSIVMLSLWMLFGNG